jgi:DNA-binding MarR family transcriptional regulator
MENEHVSDRLDIPRRTEATAPSPALDHEVEAFLVASRTLVGVAAASLVGLDEITFPQFRALVVLTGSGHETVGDLARALDIHPSTATRLCDRLVRKRLVRRVRARADRRETDVTLTPDGRQIVEQVMRRRRRAINAVLDRMAPGERAAASLALERFAAAAGETAPADSLAWGAATGR